MKRTPFFDGTEKPAYPGVYERRRPAYQHVPNKPARMTIGYSRWNGAYWMTTFGTVALAERSNTCSAYQNVSWRGLKEQA